MYTKLNLFGECRLQNIKYPFNSFCKVRWDFVFVFCIFGQNFPYTVKFCARSSVFFVFFVFVYCSRNIQYPFHCEPFLQCQVELLPKLENFDLIICHFECFDSLNLSK